MTGQWIQRKGLTQENVHALAVFNESISGLIGSDHRTTGLYYTQIVSGQTNFAFAAESAPVVPNSRYSPEWIYTEVSFEGKVSPAKIKKEGPIRGGIMGGWVEHQGLAQDNVHALEVYNESIALLGLIGVQHRTTGTYFTQLVNGVNYAFASESAAVVPAPSFTPEWVYTYESLNHEIMPAKFETHSPVTQRNPA